MRSTDCSKGLQASSDGSTDLKQFIMNEMHQVWFLFLTNRVTSFALKGVSENNAGASDRGQMWV